MDTKQLKKNLKAAMIEEGNGSKNPDSWLEMKTNTMNLVVENEVNRFANSEKAE